MSNIAVKYRVTKYLNNNASNIAKLHNKNSVFNSFKNYLINFQNKNGSNFYELVNLEYIYRPTGGLNYRQTVID